MPTTGHPLRDQVLEALKNLRFPAAQRASALLQNQAIRSSLFLPWPDPSPDDLALALSTRLKEIIKELQPASPEDLRQQDWLHYYVLYYLFVQNDSADVAAQVLNISQSYLYRLRKEAVDNVATLLTAGIPAAASAEPTPGYVRLFSLAEPIPLTTDFCGRESELSWYRQALAQEKLAVIHGFAGTGKTALAAQLAAERQQAGQPLIWITFYSQVNTDLDSFLHLLAHPLDEMGHPELLRFLSTCVQNPHQYPADIRIQYALNCLAASGAALFLDDVHLVEDEPNLQRFLRRLVPRQEPARLPLVVTSRSEPSFALGRLIPPLAGLSEANTEHLLHRAGIHWLGEKSLAELQRRTAGNVVLIKFVITWTQSEGIADWPERERNERTRDLIAQLGHQNLLLEEAMAALDVAERSILDRITLCRKAVDLNSDTFAALFTGLETGPTCRALNELERRNLLLRPRGTALYRAHSLIQNYVLAQLERSPEHRAELHRVLADCYRHVGDWAEAAFHLVRAAEPAAAAVLLAIHAEELIKRGQVLAWVVLAAEIPDQALTLEQRQIWYPALGQARVQVIGKSAEALEWLDQTLAGEENPALRYALLLVRYEVHSAQGNRAAQLQDQGELEQLAEVLGDDRCRMTVFWCKSSYAWSSGDYAGAIAAAQATVELAQAVGDTFYEDQANVLWGSAALRQSDYPVVQARLERGLALEQASGLARQASLTGLGSLHYFQGNYAEARRYWEEALEECRREGSLREELSCLSNLGMVTLCEGSYDRAREHLEQAVKIAQDFGVRETEGVALANLGRAWLSLSHYARAEELSARGLEVARQVGDRYGEIKSLVNLGNLWRRRGGLAQARAYLEKAGASAEQIGVPRLTANALTALGRLSMAEGRPQDAVQPFSRAIELYRQLHERRLLLEPLAGLAQAFLTQGQPTQALPLVEEVWPSIAGQDFLCGPEEPFSVYLVCSQLLRPHDPIRARQILAKARMRLQEQADRIADPGLRQLFLENGPGHREILIAPSEPDQ